MQLYDSGNYKYACLDMGLVVFTRKSELVQSKGEVVRIASNTSNTWQQDRSQEEKLSNTAQGKQAEEMFSDFVSFFQTRKSIVYMSYDEFRNDNFAQHAPMDGILFKNGNPVIDDIVRLILKDQEEGSYVKLSTHVRKQLTDASVYTVEIKSSRIPDKDYKLIDRDNFQNRRQQNTLIDALRERDLFTYPEYTRSLGKGIRNFEQYCEYVRVSVPEFANMTGDELRSAIVLHESRAKSDIHTRIFLDWTSTGSVIGYLLGYALKDDFFKEPKIITMPRKGKSEDALYYAYPIRKTEALQSLFTDSRLW